MKNHQPGALPLPPSHALLGRSSGLPAFTAARRASFPLGLIAGGALGNILDRVRQGYVTDFLDFKFWPVFNVADISLDVGVALLVWWLLFSPEHRHAGAQQADVDAKVDNEADGGAITDGESTL